MNPFLVLSDGSGTAAGVGLGAFFIFWLILGIAIFAFWLWMLIDILGSSMPTNDKILWALVIFFLPLIGSLIYFFVRRGSARSTV
jgi:hypothetical protein